jgi:hypothetical protein
VGDVPGNVVGEFVAGKPLGWILHATRSGQPYSERQEFDGTVNYVKAGAAGLGWEATIGPGLVAIHNPPHEWAYNAREHSDDYRAVEIAQAHLGDPISDATLETLAWYIRTYGGATPRVFVFHSGLPAGQRDGKTDPFASGDPAGAVFLQRLRALL